MQLPGAGTAGLLSGPDQAAGTIAVTGTSSSAAGAAEEEGRGLEDAPAACGCVAAPTARAMSHAALQWELRVARARLRMLERDYAATSGALARARLAAAHGVSPSKTLLSDGDEFWRGGGCDDPVGSLVQREKEVSRSRPLRWRALHSDNAVIARGDRHGSRDAPVAGLTSGSIHRRLTLAQRKQNQRRRKKRERNQQLPRPDFSWMRSQEHTS